MCNSKEAKLATIQPMYFCPYCLGSALVQFWDAGASALCAQTRTWEGILEAEANLGNDTTKSVTGRSMVRFRVGAQHCSGL